MKEALVTIRPADINDLHDMFLISIEAHRHSYGDLIPQSEYARFIDRYTINKDNEENYRQKMQKKLLNTDWRVWVAIDNESGEIAGYTLGYRKNTDRFQKHGLFILPKFQGRGIGTMLFDTSIQAIDSGIIDLTVIENNYRAIELYTKNGFKEVGRSTKSYFGARQIVMEYKKN